MNGVRFHMAMRAVLARPDLSHRDKLVMVSLLDFASDDGLAWPSVATIAQATQVSPRRVTESLGRLRSSGIITIDARGGGSLATRYRVSTPDETAGVGVTKPHPHPGPIRTPDETAPLTESASTPDENDVGPLTKTVETPAVSSPYRLNTDSLTDSKTGAGRGMKRKRSATVTEVVFPPELDSDEFRRAWAEWEQHRVEKKAALTASTTAKQLKQLARIGQAAAIKLIERSILNGWQGLIFDSDRNGAGGNGKVHASPAANSRLAAIAENGK